MRERLGYVPALDGLRGAAIALVVAQHYFGLPGGGPMGVGLFFVLSGFLITTLLLEELEQRGRIGLRGFYARRARRLFPALAVLLVVYLIVRAAQGHDGLPVVALGGLYFGNVVQAFSIHNVVGGTALGHLWSLAEEEQFYVVWPCALIVLVRARRMMLWLCLLLAGLIAYRTALALNGASIIRLYYAPDTHADWLLAGAILAVLRRRGVKAVEPVALAGFGGLVYGSLTNPYTYAWAEWTCPILVAACVAIVAAAYSRTQMASLLSIRPLVGLGKVSYSLYLWHVPVFAALGYRHPEIAVLLSLAAALASYRYVEQPFRRRRRTRVAAAADPTDSSVTAVAPRPAA